MTEHEWENLPSHLLRGVFSQAQLHLDERIAPQATNLFTVYTEQTLEGLLHVVKEAKRVPESQDPRLIRALRATVLGVDLLKILTEYGGSRSFLANMDQPFKISGKVGPPLARGFWQAWSVEKGSSLRTYGKGAGPTTVMSYTIIEKDEEPISGKSLLEFFRESRTHWCAERVETTNTVAGLSMSTEYHARTEKLYRILGVVEELLRHEEDNHPYAFGQVLFNFLYHHTLAPRLMGVLGVAIEKASE